MIFKKNDKIKRNYFSKQEELIEYKMGRTAYTATLKKNCDGQQWQKLASVSLLEQ